MRLSLEAMLRTARRFDPHPPEEETSMATIYEIRRDNLKALIREHGNGEVSKAAGYSSASYISQMVGPKSTPASDRGDSAQG